MNHLTDIYLGTMHSQITYDPLRRMTGKITDNTLVFSGAVYDETAKPHAIDYAEVDAGSFSEHSLTYTCFDKVKTITQGNNTLEYTYGYDRQRIFMEEHDNGVERTKRYVGNCEFMTVTENNATTEKMLTYLTGPMGVFAVVEQQGNDESLHYILKDHLGSWTTIIDAEGVVEQELSFDAWGNLRNPVTWSGCFSGTPMFDRGFTGHEHLYAFGLINMNGRMYDPQTSSFLSVDAYVQSPDNSQSFNRYAYCMNNPLKYTDPSGWVMQGGMTPSNPYHENWGVNFAEKAYTTVEVKQMLWSMGVSTENWMMGNEMHGGGGSPQNCFYDEKGNYWGTDGLYDGKLFIFCSENSDAIKKKADIKRFFKGKNTTISMVDIYQFFIEIEPSKENRKQMYLIVSADDGTGGTSDQNNREYGGYIKNGVVIPVEPGPVGDPRYQLTLSIEIPFGYSSFHSHASGYYKERNWTDVSDAWWQQMVDQKDINNAGDQVHYVFGRWNKCVYIYDKRGTQAILREKTFLNLGP